MIRYYDLYSNKSRGMWKQLAEVEGSSEDASVARAPPANGGSASGEKAKNTAIGAKTKNKSIAEYTPNYNPLRL